MKIEEKIVRGHRFSKIVFPPDTGVACEVIVSQFGAKLGERWAYRECGRIREVQDGWLIEPSRSLGDCRRPVFTPDNVRAISAYLDREGRDGWWLRLRRCLGKKLSKIARRVQP